MSHFTPVNQVRLTNVAVVRLKRKGKRFELACYKNSVLSWRNGTETDLNEVLQTRSIFTNVSKGTLAKQSDILDIFKTSDVEKVLKKIINDGELQLGEKERQVQKDSVFKEIARIVADQCLDSKSKKPLSAATIERAMRDEIHYSVQPSRNSKQQALDVCRQLCEVLPIERSRMRVEIEGPTNKEVKVIRDRLVEADNADVESQDWGTDFRLVCTIDPGLYRTICSDIEQATRGKGTVQVTDVRTVSVE